MSGKNYDADSMARAKGFESQKCSICQNFTLAREGSTLKCATCGNIIHEISKSQWLRFIEHAWPDKSKIRALLADNIGTTTREWPPVGTGILFNMLAEMGGKVEGAKNPEECWDAFIYVLNYLSCPEPGWKGITLEVIT